MSSEKEKKDTSWRHKLYVVIFEAETPMGKYFDVALMWAILLSITVICLESIKSINSEYGEALHVIEWTLTSVFLIEYFLRVISVRKPLSYILSFYGLIDLFAILPPFLTPFFSGARSLMVIRSIRLLRVFRLLKLGRYSGEADVLAKALRSGRHKVTVFLMAVFTIALFMGAVMFAVEGEQSGFTSIPKGMYWAIVTMTTVGYGDLAPQTDLGRAIASLLMVMGYGIIAVPTGIVSAEMVATSASSSTRTCSSCMKEGHNIDALFCRICGSKL